MTSTFRPSGPADRSFSAADAFSAETPSLRQAVSGWQDSPETASRRAFPRIPCRVLVDYVIDGRAYRDCIANLSEGGAFIETSIPLEAGQAITLSFSLFQDQRPVKVVGEVAWTGPTGVGVRFNQNAAMGQIGAQDSLGAVPSQQPEATARAVHPDRSGRTIEMPDRRRADVSFAAVSIWAAILALGVLGFLSRSETNARIQALTDEVDRSSQAWTRIEKAIANRLEPTRAPVSGTATPVPPSPARTPVPVEAPRVSEVRPAPVTIPAPNGPSAERPRVDPPAATDLAFGPETVYVVQQGDNLFRIGLRFNLSSKALMDYNNLAGENAIFVGQRIRIPAGSPK